MRWVLRKEEERLDKDRVEQEKNKYLRMEKSKFFSPVCMKQENFGGQHFLWAQV
jgi:hypothetical protein